MTLESNTDAGSVTTAQGDFYQAYKKGTLEFLEFVRKVGEDGIASGALNSADKDQVDSGLQTLRAKSPDLFRLLAKKIDEDAPSFWDECIVEYLWSILGSVFLIAQHSGITVSAKEYMKVMQVKKAQQAHVSLATGKNGALREAIKAEAVERSCALVDSEQCARRLEPGIRNRLGIDEQKRGYSWRTIQRQISAILEECEPS